ncbi:hypothetical protein [Streptomyces griseosporeus]|uniref:hypothetical protein n=1 Tax=Streptomyces griseosporeus TaxID=1910 RepID=UPI0007186307|nr:hypothetical protein SHL15_6677 [Streptomyces hygroscopicus subsp. limoneus]
MSSSRFSSLSAATRQWVVDQYTLLIAEHTDKNRRVGTFFDSLLDGASNGELCAIEYFKALTGPGISTLDSEMMEKFAALTSSGPDDNNGRSGALTPPGLHDQRRTAGDQVAEPIVCGRDTPLPQQRALFPLTVIDDKIQDVRAKLQRIDAEYRRLQEQERDSREVRKMMRAEKKLLQEQLGRLMAAKARAKAAPDIGMDDLDKLGLDTELLGLNATTLAVLR